MLLYDQTATLNLISTQIIPARVPLTLSFQSESKCEMFVMGISSSISMNEK